MPGLLEDDALVRRIISAASAAPSVHNTQPWRFRVAGPDLVELHAELDRMLWIADPRGRALYLSCGAALFNLRLAVRNLGYRPVVWALPDAQSAFTLIASVQLLPGRPATFAERAMFEAIGHRHSSRMPFSDRRLPEAVQVSLEQAAGYESTSLRMLGHHDATVVLRLAEAADRELAADADHQAELAEWIPRPAETGTGLPLEALGPKPDRDPSPVRDFGAAQPAGRPTATFELRPQLGVLSTARDRNEDWLRAGQALQRVLLTATRHGVATSLLYQPIELHDLRGGQLDWWPWPEQPQIIIRFGYALSTPSAPSAPATPRKSVAEILDSGPVPAP
jgi:nitroreductase